VEKLITLQMTQTPARAFIRVDSTATDIPIIGNFECISPRSVLCNDLSDLDVHDNDFTVLDQMDSSEPSSPSSDNGQRSNHLQLTRSSLALIGLRPSFMKNHVLKVKTMTGAEIQVPLAETSCSYQALHVKSFICQNLPLQPSDIILIRQGKEVKDDEVIDPFIHGSSKPMTIHALTRTSSTTPISLLCKGDGKCSTMEVLTSTRIFHFKRELFSKKISSLRPSSQRLIIGGRQLHDNLLLGDYLLQSLASRKKMMSNNQVIVHISKTMNISHEVEVRCKLNDHTQIKFSVEISIPTVYMREILFRQFFIPKESHLVLSLVVKGRTIELHPDYTLLDYGISSETKSIDVHIAKVVEVAPASVVPLKHVPPSPAEAFLMDEKLKAIEVQTPLAKKRPMDGDKSEKSTSLFKGMKKGFFESKSSKPKRSKQAQTVETDAPTYPGLKKGFLIKDSKQSSRHSKDTSPSR